MKKREGDPWMPADRYGRSLRGFGVNLPVPDVGRALRFRTRVLDEDGYLWVPDVPLPAAPRTSFP